MTTRSLALGVLTSAVCAGACETLGMSYGDANRVIVVMAPERWEDVADDVYAALERTTVKVRDEGAFSVTYQEPYGDGWPERSRFRQMLLVGRLDDPWMQEALADLDPRAAQPGLYRAQDVWARGQMVTALVLSREAGADELAEQLSAAYVQLDIDFRASARVRMYASGVDTALADTLQARAGFALLLPEEYTWASEDSTFVFRNDDPDSDLIRQVAVTWVSAAPAEIDREALLDWRTRVAAGRLGEPQNAVPNQVTSERLAFLGYAALEIRGQWTTLPDAGRTDGGPFITRAAVCESQDRSYLLDAWLYAPALEPYEYIIQLETILDTFRCG